MRAFRGDNGYLNKPTRLPNGFLKADAFLTRVGVFPYQNKDGTTRRELRLPDEVFKPDSMGTFEMSPITLGHPARPVTAKNAKRVQVGHSGQDVRRDSHRMRGSVMITDDEAIAAMDRGVRQVSNGYFCDLEMAPGVTQGIDGVDDGLAYDCIQRNIVGNHIAIVERGRAGADVGVRVDEYRADGAEDVAFQVQTDNPFAVQPTTAGAFEVLNTDTGCVLSEHPTEKSAQEQLSLLKQAGVSNASSDSLATSLLATAKRTSKNDDAPFHFVGFVAWPLIMERGLTTTEVAQALSVQENEVEFILSGAVMPTGQQLEGLAELLEVPASELKDLLPERQREQTDGDTLMEDFKITLNGVTFCLKGDSAARQAVEKQIADDAGRIDALSGEKTTLVAAVATEKARADSAETEKAKAEAKADAAVDPTAMRARIDARLELERTAAEVLGDAFDVSKTDEEIRTAVILKVQPAAKLDGQPDAYVSARFDSAVEIHAADKAATAIAGTGTAAPRTRVAARDAAGNDDDPVAKARADAAARNRDRWKTPLSATKDAAPEQVRISH